MEDTEYITESQERGKKMIKTQWYAGPSRGRGKGGNVFPGPTTFAGPRHSSKILKKVFQMASFWPQIHITKLSQTPSRMVRGHPLLYPLPYISSPLDARSRRLRNEVVIGPRENGFPGPAVALDEPDDMLVIMILTADYRNHSKILQLFTWESRYTTTPILITEAIYHNQNLITVDIYTLWPDVTVNCATCTMIKNGSDYQWMKFTEQKANMTQYWVN